MYVISFIAIISVGAVIFGAIGKDGMKSVRGMVPNVGYMIPAPHDLDKWQYGHGA